MTGFLGSSTLLWVAVAALALAALIGLVVVIVPGPARIPVERRRPGVGTAPNTLGVVATAQPVRIPSAAQRTGSRTEPGCLG